MRPPQPTFRNHHPRPASVAARRIVPSDQATQFDLVDVSAPRHLDECRQDQVRGVNCSCTHPCAEFRTCPARCNSCAPLLPERRLDLSLSNRCTFLRRLGKSPSSLRTPAPCSQSSRDRQPKDPPRPHHETRRTCPRPWPVSASPLLVVPGQ